MLVVNHCCLLKHCYIIIIMNLKVRILCNSIAYVKLQNCRYSPKMCCKPTPNDYTSKPLLIAHAMWVIKDLWLHIVYAATCTGREKALQYQCVLSASYFQSATSLISCTCTGRMPLTSLCTSYKLVVHGDGRLVKNAMPYYTI